MYKFVGLRVEIVQLAIKSIKNAIPTTGDIPRPSEIFNVNLTSAEGSGVGNSPTSDF